MTLKPFEKPEGSGEWWVWITHQGFTTSMSFGTDKLLAFEMAEGGNAAIADGADVTGIYDAFVQVAQDYRKLSVKERLSKILRVHKGGLAD